jgi:hypothetical protein
MKLNTIAAIIISLTTGQAMAADTATKNTQDLAKYQADEDTVAKNIKTFDTLDFDVYSNQKWDRLRESHAKDILVHYPDGHITTGLEPHIEELKPMFVFAPDTRIKTHPVKFGSGPWTSVIGIMEGTFTKPMPDGKGGTIAPTGKPFKLSMVTIGHWTPAGVMDEEYLFWDNQGLMKEIGLAK